MELLIRRATPDAWLADALVFFAFEDNPAEVAGLDRFMEDQACGRAVRAQLRDFKAKAGELAVVHVAALDGPARLVLAGLGKAAAFSPEAVRRAAALAIRRCRESNCEVVGMSLSCLLGLPESSAVLVEEAVYGAQAGLYRFTAFKGREAEGPDGSIDMAEAAIPAEKGGPDGSPEPRDPQTLVLYHDEELPGCAGGACDTALDWAAAQAAGVKLARDLANTPANVATPGHIARAAEELAARHGFDVEVMELSRAADEGMGAFAAVARGSAEPAKFVIVDTRPAGTGGEEEAPLVFVGKGVTFDSGGISLKPSAGMEAMKTDMSGAAAVLGTLEAIGRMGGGPRVVALLPLTENMPGGRAIKPGDVVRTLCGITVEVVNTDAEGRLILCDALTYAARFAPRAVVDVATLTGACVVALGRKTAGLFSNCDSLTRQLAAAGDRLGELAWPMPLYDFFRDDLKSDVADMKNVGSREGGAIAAAVFLKAFAPEGVPWAHLDIAGPARGDKDEWPTPKGGTGFGVRLLCALARDPEAFLSGCPEPGKISE